MYVLATLALQVGCAYIVTYGDRPWYERWELLVVAYSIGGICNHSMTLAMHEISHDLAGAGILGKALGFLANAPLGIPAYASFRRYHFDHHKYQGEDGVDTDVPTATEGAIVGTNPLLKAVWMLAQPLFYALRPLITAGKVPSSLELLNLVFILGFDVAVYYICGQNILGPLYLVASTLLGMGLHPMAGHFVAEHYTFVPKQETYSYYGPLNWFSFYVGYHNEHHDLCNVPGSKLRELRDSAPEQYESLPVHHSWIKVLWRYITSPIMTPYSRVRRATLPDDEVQHIRAQ